MQDTFQNKQRIQEYDLEAINILPGEICGKI